MGIKAGLSKSSSNQWNNPILLTSTTRQVFSILHPSKFDTFCLPFSNYLPTPFIPLPMEYTITSRGKLGLVSKWQNEKQEASLTCQQGSMLESLVKREFNVFLDSYSNQTIKLKHLARLK